MFKITGKPEQVLMIYVAIGFLCCMAFGVGVKMGFTAMSDYLEIRDQKAARTLAEQKR